MCWLAFSRLWLEVWFREQLRNSNLTFYSILKNKLVVVDFSSRLELRRQLRGRVCRQIRLRLLPASPNAGSLRAGSGQSKSLGSKFFRGKRILRHPLLVSLGPIMEKGRRIESQTIDIYISRSWKNPLSDHRKTSSQIWKHYWKLFKDLTYYDLTQPLFKIRCSD